MALERWWIRDSFCPAELAWRAVIFDPQLGVTSSADATPWAAIARAAAHHALKRCGKGAPSQAREELDVLVARARAAMADQARPRPAGKRPRAASRGRRAAPAAERSVP